MHRSGTTLVAETLSALGIFMGNDLEKNHESKSFLALNDFILKTAHAYWDQPLPINNLYSDEISVEVLRKYMDEQVNRKTHFAKFLGSKNIIQRKNNLMWGWKDPRNTLTWPIWKMIFPDAKIIYVYRNGIDVANSLYQRENEVRGGINLPHYSCRCLDINRAFSLWEEYNHIFINKKNEINKSDLFEIKYEDLLINPETELKRLIEFISLDVKEKKIANLIKNINGDRAFSFLKSEDLKNLYAQKKNSQTMINLNYNNIIE